MKVHKLYALLLTMVLCLFIVGCGANPVKIGEKSQYEVNNGELTLTIKNDTLSNKKTTLILTNQTDALYYYGNPFSIEYEKDGIWYELEPVNDLYFTLPAFNLEAGKSVEIVVDWEYGYGELSSGNYRIVKAISPDLSRSLTADDYIYITVEFTINK